MKAKLKPVNGHARKLLALNMRQADREEIAALTGWSPREGLDFCVDTGEVSVAIWLDDQLAGITGVRKPTIMGAAMPWLLSTHALEDRRTAFNFARKCLPVIEAMRDHYGDLQNYVDARNLITLRWLKWCGFEIADPIPLGLCQRPFHPFSMRA